MMRTLRQITPFSLALLALPLIGCESKISKAEAEEALKTSLAKHGVPKATVVCPDGQKAGTPFECKITDQGGNTVAATVTGNKDAFRVKVTEKSLQVKKFGESQEASFKEKGLLVPFACPDITVFLVPGTKFTCDVKVAEGPGKMGYIVDGKGNLVRDDATTKMPGGEVAAQDPDESAATDPPLEE
jgi:hypothetical protein